MGSSMNPNAWKTSPLVPGPTQIGSCTRTIWPGPKELEEEGLSALGFIFGRRIQTYYKCKERRDRLYLQGKKDYSHYSPKLFGVLLINVMGSVCVGRLSPQTVMASLFLRNDVSVFLLCQFEIMVLMGWIPLSFVLTYPLSYSYPYFCSCSHLVSAAVFC